MVLKMEQVKCDILCGCTKRNDDCLVNFSRKTFISMNVVESFWS